MARPFPRPRVARLLTLGIRNPTNRTNLHKMRTFTMASSQCLKSKKGAKHRRRVHLAFLKNQSFLSLGKFVKLRLLRT